MIGLYIMLSIAHMTPPLAAATLTMALATIWITTILLVILPTFTPATVQTNTLAATT